AFPWRSPFPLYLVASSLPLSETTHGPFGPWSMPHAFWSSGSVCLACPSIFDTRFVTRKRSWCSACSDRADADTAKLPSSATGRPILLFMAGLLGSIGERDCGPTSIGPTTARTVANFNPRLHTQPCSQRHRQGALSHGRSTEADRRWTNRKAIATSDEASV